MAIILAVLFVIALCGLYHSIFNDNDSSESMFKTYFLPNGEGTLEIDRQRGVLTLRGVDPDSEEGHHWKRIGASTWETQYWVLPSHLTYENGRWDEVTIEFDLASCHEIKRESTF